VLNVGCTTLSRKSSYWNVLTTLIYQFGDVRHTDNTLYLICPHRIKMPRSYKTLSFYFFGQPLILSYCDSIDDVGDLSKPDGLTHRKKIFLDILSPQFELCYRQTFLKQICLSRGMRFRNAINFGNKYIIASSIGSVYLDCKVFKDKSIKFKYELLSIPSSISLVDGKWKLFLQPDARKYKTLVLKFEVRDGKKYLLGSKQVLDIPAKKIPYREYDNYYEILIEDVNGEVFAPSVHGFIVEGGHIDYYDGPLLMDLDNLQSPYNKYQFFNPGKVTHCFYEDPDGLPYEPCMFKGKVCPRAPFNGKFLIIPCPSLFGDSIYSMPFKRMSYDEVWTCRDYIFDEFGNMLNIEDVPDFFHEDPDPNYPVYDHFGNPHFV